MQRYAGLQHRCRGALHSARAAPAIVRGLDTRSPHRDTRSPHASQARAQDAPLYTSMRPISASSARRGVCAALRRHIHHTPLCPQSPIRYHIAIIYYIAILVAMCHSPCPFAIIPGCARRPPRVDLRRCAAVRIAARHTRPHASAYSMLRDRVGKGWFGPCQPALTIR
jgi:hypothetical protein